MSIETTIAVMTAWQILLRVVTAIAQKWGPIALRYIMSHDITQRKTVFSSPRPESKGTARRIIGNTRTSRTFEFDDDDASEVYAFVKLVATSGDLCCFTLTSDRGALSITVVSGSQRTSAYAKDSEQLFAALSNLRDELYA